MEKGVTSPYTGETDSAPGIPKVTEGRPEKGGGSLVQEKGSDTQKEKSGQSLEVAGTCEGGETACRLPKLVGENTEKLSRDAPKDVTGSVPVPRRGERLILRRTAPEVSVAGVTQLEAAEREEKM